MAGYRSRVGNRMRRTAGRAIPQRVRGRVVLGYWSDYAGCGTRTGSPGPDRAPGRPAPVGYHRGMVSLSRADVAHVAHLARLGLAEEELDRLSGQLNHILDQYAILARLDTDAIAPTAQTIELENILREDVVTPSLPVESVLANAAESADGYIVVPAILGE